MGPDIEKVINELSLRMRLIRAMQEDQEAEGSLSEREVLILQQLAEQGPLSVSQIASAWPNVSESTISTTLTRLWQKKKLVSKTISPDNQRVTIIALTDKGRAELQTVFKHRNERFNALFRAIDVTEEEKEVLVRVCRRGIQYLDKFLGIKRDTSLK